MNYISALVKSLAAVGIAAASIASVSAAPIIGTANLSFGQVQVTLGNVDWNPPINPPPNAVPTYGSFTTAGFANTGSFAGVAFTGLTSGFVQDLSANPLDGNYFPVGSLTSHPNFLQFSAQPGWLFNGMVLATGTFPGSPYILTEQGGNVSATISVAGTVCDTGGDMSCDLTDDLSKFNSVFSAQYTNTTVALLRDILLAGNALPNNTWSGTVEASAIPEPASLGLLGLGLAGVGFARRRKSK